MPTAAPDVVVALAGTPTSFDVLANDSGSGLVLDSWTQPAHGSLVHDGGGRFTYTANAAFTGVDGFTYTVRDAQGATASGTVTISVLAPNQDPLAADDVATTTAGTPVDIPVLANDADPDGDPLTISGIGVPAHGSVTLRPGQAIRYVPQPGFTGTDRFLYTVEDGRGGLAQATVTVQVGRADAPPEARDDAYTVESGTTAVLDPLANDIDPDGDGLRLVGLELPAHGRIAVVDGRIHYTPDPGFEGEDGFDYTVADGRGGTATARVRLTVVRPNLPPTAQADAVTTTENTPVVLDLLANDADPDGDPLRLTGLELPAHGQLALAADGTLTYTPDPGFTGQDSFRYTVEDGRGGRATASVTITVQPSSALEPRFANGYARRRRILLPPQELDETLSDFRLLVRIEDPSLRSVAQGGVVESDQGHDIRFEAEDGTPLAHDLLTYDPAAGRLVAFVRLPSWRTGIQTRLHLYYGKPGLAASEADPAATWQGELAVWSLPDGSDRSGQGRHLTTTALTAEVVEGLPLAGFDGTSAKAELADATFLSGHTSLCLRLVALPDAAMAGSDRYVFLQGTPSALFGEGGLELRYDDISSLGVDDSLVATLRLDSGEIAWFRSDSRQHLTGALQLYHLCWRSGQHLTLHRNGQPVPGIHGKKAADGSWSDAPATGATLMQAGAPFSLGLGDGAPGAAYAGRLGLVRLSPTLPSAFQRRLETANLLEPWRLYAVGPEERADMADFPPVAADLEATTEAGRHVDIRPGARAFDPEGGPLRPVAAGTPAHGTVSLFTDRLRYTPFAGFVGSDRFTYTLEDAAGLRHQAVVHLTVTPRTALEPEYPPPQREIAVASTADLVRALNGARPGDHIILEDGDYGGPVYIDALQGRPEAPVVIRARNLLGARIRYGLRFRDADAADVMVWGLDIRGTSFMNGRRIIFRRCRFFTEYQDGGYAVALLVERAPFGRIDYCHIRMETKSDVEARTGQPFAYPTSVTRYFGIYGSEFSSANFEAGLVSRDFIIHRCYFDGGIDGGSYYYPSLAHLIVSDSGWVTVQPKYRHIPLWTIRHCRFDTWRTAGPAVYLKASNCTMERCHLVARAGSTFMNAPRHGFDNRYLDCRFEGAKLEIMSGQHLFHNVLADRFTLYDGNVPWDYTGGGNSKWPTAYGCRFYNCQGLLRIGKPVKWDHPVEGTRVYGHTGTIEYYFHRDTLVSPQPDPAYPARVPPVVDPAEVGPQAPWRGPDA